MSSDLTLAVFAKAPVPGQVKTRLCPPLTPAQAARLACAFVNDTVAKIAAPAPNSGGAGAEGSHAEMKGSHAGLPLPRLTPQNWGRGAIRQADSHPVLRWRPGDFGRNTCRLAAGSVGAAGRWRFGRAHGPRPRPLPDPRHRLPPPARRLCAQAIVALTCSDVVLGPAEDGGYYLIALRAPQPTLFDGIAWSTASVLSQTLARAEALGLRVTLLPPCYDIDTWADLCRLRHDLDAGTAEGCPATCEELQDLSSLQLF